jgi:hypothetical protein
MNEVLQLSGWPKSSHWNRRRRTELVQGTMNNKLNLAWVHGGDFNLTEPPRTQNLGADWSLQFA